MFKFVIQVSKSDFDQFSWQSKWPTFDHKLEYYGKLHHTDMGPIHFLAFLPVYVALLDREP